MLSANAHNPFVLSVDLHRNRGREVGRDTLEKGRIRRKEAKSLQRTTNLRQRQTYLKSKDCSNVFDDASDRLLCYKLDR